MNACNIVLHPQSTIVNHFAILAVSLHTYLFESKPTHISAFFYIRTLMQLMTIPFSHLRKLIVILSFPKPSPCSNFPSCPKNMFRRVSFPFFKAESIWIYRHHLVNVSWIVCPIFLPRVIVWGTQDNFLVKLLIFWVDLIFVCVVV